MSQQTSVLSEVLSNEPLSPGTLAYLGERARNRYYDFVLKRFRASGITKAELARRLGKGPDRVNRLLAAPGNWTIDTIAELLAGISQEEMIPDAQRLGAGAPKNITQADLLAGQVPKGSRKASTHILDAEPRVTISASDHFKLSPLISSSATLAYAQ